MTAVGSAVGAVNPLLWLAVGLLAGAGATVAALIGLRVARRRHPAEQPARDGAEQPARDGAEQPARDGAEQPARDGADRAARDGADRAARDRDALVTACLALADRLHDTSPPDWSRLLRDLARIGVEAQIPDGAAFDPAAHDAVGTQPPAAGDRDLTVAETVFPGFTDRGRVLRRPQVVIYRGAGG